MRHLFLTLALAACGAPSSSPPPPIPAAPRFEADAAPTGPSLVITIDPEQRTGAVVARDLGPVFGVAFQLSSDASLTFDTAATSDAFGADGKVLHVAKGASARFGLTRPAPTAAPVDLTAARTLATFTFQAAGPVDSRPTLDRVSVRRVDGSFVPVSVASGRLVLP